MHGEGGVTYQVVEDSSDDEDESKDKTGEVADVGDEPTADEQQPSAKRVKVEGDTKAAADSVPKWSNPDPYTVLPPVEEGRRKNKDVVKLIRKSRVLPADAGSAKQSAAPVEAADFISFDDDEESDTDSSVVELSGPTGGQRRDASGAHKDVAPLTGPLKAVPEPRRSEAKSAKAAGAQTSDKGKSLAPPKPQEQPQPRSLSSRKRTIDDMLKPPAHAKLNKPGSGTPSGNVTSDWQPVPGENPCPWATRNHAATANMGVR